MPCKCITNTVSTYDTNPLVCPFNSAKALMSAAYAFTKNFGSLYCTSDWYNQPTMMGYNMAKKYLDTSSGPNTRN